MTRDLFSRPEWPLLAALAIGLLIGAERERRKGEGAGRRPAGVRTFTVVALLGGLSALLGEAMTLLGAGLVTLIALAGYAFRSQRDPGLTGEVALVATFLLGALAHTHVLTALECGVLVAMLLAYRVQIHRLVRESLTERELLDGIAFAIAAVVVLPLLPNRSFGPFDLFNPFRLWRLVVMLMGLSAVGYVAQRLVGARFGLVAAGLAGGLVSASAAVAAMAHRSRADPKISAACAGGAVAAVLASTAYMIALLAAVNPSLLPALAPAFAISAVIMLAYAVVLGWRSGGGDQRQAKGRAFNFGAAVVFVGLVALVTLLSRALDLYLGATGALIGAGVAGLVDAHAAAVSMATLAGAGGLAEPAACLGVMVGFSTNMAVKAPIAYALGSPPFARRVTAGLVLLLASVWAGYDLAGPWLVSFPGPPARGAAAPPPAPPPSRP